MRLGRPPIFDGNEAEWPEWSFQGRSYLSLIGDTVADDLAKVEGIDYEVSLSEMNEQRRANSRKCFYALTMLVKGPPLGILRQIDDANGYEAWRKLCARFDSNLAGRQHNLLQQILKPKPFGETATAWEDSVLAWKRDVAKWERLATDILTEQVKVSVMLENAPPGIRGQLALQGHTTALQVETAVLNYLGVTRFLPGGSSSTAPMEVDAIAKDKGKDKDKQKPKSKAKAKGKSQSGNQEVLDLRQAWPHCRELLVQRRCTAGEGQGQRQSQGQEQGQRS